MLVKVTKLIFRGGSRVRPGEILDIPKDESGDWYKKIDTPKAVEPKSPTKKN